MKLLWVAVVIILLVAGFFIYENISNTIYGGIQSVGGNENTQKWSGEIRITGDTLITTPLEIEPGTKIIVSAHKDDISSILDIEIPPDGFLDDDPTRLKSYADTHSSILFQGPIKAIGTKDNPIIFTSDAENPDYADWGAIVIIGNKAELEYVIVEYTKTGITVPVSSSDISVKNSIVRHAMWGCFSIHGSNGLFENNEVYDCGHEGFDVGGNARIINNTIYDSHTSIVILDGSPVIKNNNFQEEVTIIGGTPILSNNEIDESLMCDENKIWDYDNYMIPCRGDPYLLES